MELGGKKMEFTQEQLDHIDLLIANATKDMFTEDELNRRVTAEVDRRVERGIQKGLETHRAKWEAEYTSRAKLSAEEVAKLELKEQMDDLARREAEINTRSNMIDAKDMLTNAGIPQDDYVKFMDLLISNDKEITVKNVNNFIDTFTNTKKNIESMVRKELSNVPAPKGDPEPVKGSGVENFITMAQEANIRK